MPRLAPEQHDTLDDVPEPAENPHLVGHHRPLSALATAYAAGKLPHALIFAGPRGIGKATAAFHLANHLLGHPDPSAAPAAVAAPVPDRPLFRQIASGAHPGMLHLTRPPADRASSGFKAAITVDEVRRVGRFVSHTAHDGGFRVVIVDPADDLNVNAANALLKSLEEPPPRTVFILIAHALGRLLPTIRSRCHVVRFSPLAEEDLAAVLDALSVPLPSGPERGRLLASAAGSARSAILAAHYGGLDIGVALERLMASPAAPGGEAHQLADAVAGRDRAVQFGLFNERLLDLVADAASAAARRGEGGRADRLSAAWQEMRIAIAETETYNLDRKQHALNMIFRLHDALRM